MKKYLALIVAVILYAILGVSSLVLKVISIDTSMWIAFIGIIIIVGLEKNLQVFSRGSKGREKNKVR